MMQHTHRHTAACFCQPGQTRSPGLGLQPQQTFTPPPLPPCHSNPPAPPAPIQMPSMKSPGSRCDPAG
eukprot:354342-Chlamydomonas_euryale.AAC.2